MLQSNSLSGTVMLTIRSGWIAPRWFTSAIAAEETGLARWQGWMVFLFRTKQGKP